MSVFNKPIQRIVKISDPTAGAEISFTPSGGGGVLFRSLRFRLVASAAAANRAVSLSVTNGTDEWFRSRANVTQIATEDRVYGGYEGASAGATGAAVVALDFPSNGLWVPRGHTLRTITASIDVGDQFSAIAGYGIEFPSGPEWELWPVYPYMAMWPPYPSEE